MIVGIPKETFPGERRVALVPAAVAALAKKKLEVVAQEGAGAAAGYPDARYREHGARMGGRAEVLAQADVLLQVRGHGANPEAGAADLEALRRGQLVIGFLDPLGNPEAARTLAASGVTAFALELLPRITRAQSMDALSAMATIAGYKGVILAAERLPKIFPMMMTAAGSISPAKVFVLGAGVAGLQAIATARRLGAVVEAYDVRPEVREQVESVGGKFVELPLETTAAGDAGGYAREQTAAFYEKQRELMAAHLEAADAVITTAAVPGRRAPVLVTAGMVRRMRPGSLLVDLAADTGGNCELTRPGETVVEGGVSILGPRNVAATVPFHASQMYARNVSTFLLALVDASGELQLNREDEIVRDTLVTEGGEVVHPRVRAALGEGEKGSSA